MDNAASMLAASDNRASDSVWLSWDYLNGYCAQELKSIPRPTSGNNSIQLNLSARNAVVPTTTS
jgi:hypothetical protein